LPIVRSQLEESIKDRLIEEARFQIARFFQQSKAKNLRDKYRYIMGKKLIKKISSQEDEVDHRFSSDEDFSHSDSGFESSEDR
jgi:hypothetical protein